MEKIRVGINGFGRIGRAFFRLAFMRDEIEIVAVNDLGDLENAAYLLQYDSVYGRAPFEVGWRNEGTPMLIADDEEVVFVSEREPNKLPWKELGIDVVVEATGVFADYKGSRLHLDAGAERVVITAPVKDEPPQGVRGATVLMGVNDDELESCDISSNASCTTNAASPVMAILDEAIGIQKAMLSTVHGYTASQSLVDGPSKRDFRSGRAAAQNIVPSSTGAAIATTKAITSLAGKFDGIAMRVPIVAGSIADITFLAKRPTTVEEVNNALLEAAEDDRWKPIFTATRDEIVSSDIVGQLYASIADLTLTRVVDGDLVKVCAWYDNEAGYTHSLVEHVIKTGSFIDK